MLDEQQKQSILDAHERGISMRAIVDADQGECVTVGRAELDHLLTMLAFVSGYALGKSARELDEATRKLT
jgi:hypothetical protein